MGKRGVSIRWQSDVVLLLLAALLLLPGPFRHRCGCCRHFYVPSRRSALQIRKPVVRVSYHFTSFPSIQSMRNVCAYFYFHHSSKDGSVRMLSPQQREISSLFKCGSIKYSSFVILVSTYLFHDTCRKIAVMEFFLGLITRKWIGPL